MATAYRKKQAADLASVCWRAAVVDYASSIAALWLTIASTVRRQHREILFGIRLLYQAGLISTRVRGVSLYDQATEQSTARRDIAWHKVRDVLMNRMLRSVNSDLCTPSGPI
jgi:hypothetical protein